MSAKPTPNELGRQILAVLGIKDSPGVWVSAINLDSRAGGVERVTVEYSVHKPGTSEIITTTQTWEPKDPSYTVRVGHDDVTVVVPNREALPPLGSAASVDVWADEQEQA